MSVFGTITGLFTVPCPYDDPRYPIQRFIMSGTVVGDASGGFVQLFMVVKPTGQAPSGLVFGIRRVHGKVGAPVGAVGVLAQRFKIQQGQLNDEVIGISMTVVDIPALASLADTGKVDILIGRATIGAAAAQIQLVWETNTLNENYRGYVEGFLWLPQALDNGGPLFPGEFSG